MTANDPQFWADVEELFSQVRSADADTRASVLTRHRPQAPAVVAEVESLLAADAVSGEFLATLARRGPGAETRAASPAF